MTCIEAQRKKRSSENRWLQRSGLVSELVRMKYSRQELDCDRFISVYGHGRSERQKGLGQGFSTVRGVMVPSIQTFLSLLAPTELRSQSRQYRGESNIYLKVRVCTHSHLSVGSPTPVMSGSDSYLGGWGTRRIPKHDQEQKKGISHIVNLFYKLKGGGWVEFSVSEAFWDFHGTSTQIV